MYVSGNLFSGGLGLCRQLRLGGRGARQVLAHEAGNSSSGGLGGGGGIQVMARKSRNSSSGGVGRGGGGGV